MRSNNKRWFNSSAYIRVIYASIVKDIRCFSNHVPKTVKFGEKCSRVVKGDSL